MRHQLTNTGGKGSASRVSDQAKFAANFDRIFGSSEQHSNKLSSYEEMISILKDAKWDLSPCDLSQTVQLRCKVQMPEFGIGMRDFTTSINFNNGMAIVTEVVDYGDKPHITRRVLTKKMFGEYVHNELCFGVLKDLGISNCSINVDYKHM
jgi:hypothetical protein